MLRRVRVKKGDGRKNQKKKDELTWTCYMRRDCLITSEIEGMDRGRRGFNQQITSIVKNKDTTALKDVLKIRKKGDPDHEKIYQKQNKTDGGDRKKGVFILKIKQEKIFLLHICLQQCTFNLVIFEHGTNTFFQLKMFKWLLSFYNVVVEQACTSFHIFECFRWFFNYMVKDCCLSYLHTQELL